MDSFDQMSNIIGNYWGKWLNIRNFKDITLSALQESRQSFQQEQLRFSKSIATDPFFSKLIDQNWYKENIDHQTAALEVSHRSMSSAEATVKSSIIILTHTFLDSTLLELLQFTVNNQPERWDEDLKNKTVKYEELGIKNFDQIRSELLAKKIEELERKSIIEKAEALYRICKPPADYQPVKNFIYDREKLMQYDNFRHDIVHGRHSPHIKTNNYGDFEIFSRDVGNHFISMVADHYNTPGVSSIVFKVMMQYSSNSRK